jgi:hypothetical protein
MAHSSTSCPCQEYTLGQVSALALEVVLLVQMQALHILRVHRARQVHRVRRVHRKEHLVLQQALHWVHLQQPLAPSSLQHAWRLPTLLQVPSLSHQC